MMNIILCGMMGCGKSTVGACLAERLGRAYCDTDALIVERHGRIADIFENHGEAYFRTLETETVKELVQKDPLVIATGGGLVLKQENAALLKNSGKIVFLRANVETLVRRLHADTQRPLLQNADSLRERLENLLKDRAPIYERTADITIDVDEKTPEEITGEIIKWIGQV